MKKVKFSLITAALFALLLLPLSAQVETNIPPSSLEPVNFLVRLWPVIDITATNSFKSGEVFMDIAPLWKTQTASGTTPYLSTAAGYFLTKNIGFEGELVTLGDGAGASDVDSASGLLMLRKDVGNVAGYLLLGGGYNIVREKPMGEIGLGISYRSTVVIPGLESFVDTRFSMEGSHAKDTGFMTRIGVRLHF